MIPRRRIARFLIHAFVFTLLVSAWPWTFASEATEDLRSALTKCSSIKANMARLHCYDKLANPNGKQATPPPRPSAQPARHSVEKGKWEVKIDKNPVDDSQTVTLALVADEGKSSFQQPVVLLIRCKSNTTELFISWNDYLGNEAEVLTRVGTAPASTMTWSLSTDSQATFYPRSPITFIKSFMGADRLVAQVTPYNESPVTAIFDLKGLTGAIAPLRKTCNW